MEHRTHVAAAVAALAVLTSACGGPSDPPALEVRGTNDACVASRTTLDPGTQTLRFTNRAASRSELYVYGRDDRVVAEIEHVDPGAQRSLDVDLRPGAYELACKPGETGSGIRQPITVTGAPAEEAAPSRTVSVGAVDYAFTGLDRLTVHAGETLRFELRNEGTKDHELEVLDETGRSLGEVEPVAAGATGAGVITFAKAGRYRLQCDVDDHRSRGMQAELTVT